MVGKTLPEILEESTIVTFIGKSYWPTLSLAVVLVHVKSVPKWTPKGLT